MQDVAYIKQLSDTQCKLVKLFCMKIQMLPYMYYIFPNRADNNVEKKNENF